MFQPGGPSLFELARQGLSSTRKGYDLLAPKFDKTPFRTPDPVLDQVAQVLGGRGPVARGLDVCCGTGAGMGMLREVCTQEVVGIDYSEGMLAEAARQWGSLKDPAMTLVHGDALGMEFESEFDVVTCFGAFGHFQEYQQPALLQAIHRALVPGGRFAFVTIRAQGPADGLWWIYKGFNAVMRVRNRVIKPEFIMYYLNFTVPQILPMFERVGFEIVLYDVDWDRRPYKIAVATKA